MNAKIFIIFLALLGLCGLASAKTIYVPDNNYAKIQWAVDNALDEDEEYLAHKDIFRFINVLTPKHELNKQMIRAAGTQKSNYTFSLHGNVNLLWSYVNDERNVRVDFDVIKDVNEDGIPEVVVFDGSSVNKLLLINGKDGSMIWSKNYPTKIEIATLSDDANGDGIDDIIVSWYKYNSTSDKTEFIVELVSGKDGTEIWNKAIWNKAMSTCGKVWWIRSHPTYKDLNGDGIEDILVEGEEEGEGYCCLSSEIYAISARDGSLLWNKSFEGDIHGCCYPNSDINGDGVYDFVISTYNHTSNIGRLFAIRGSDGFVMWSKSFVGDLGWIWIDPEDDFDGDGLPDVSVENNDYTNKTGSILILKGINGSTIWSKSYNSGVWEWRIGDVNGDGTTDLFLQLWNFTTRRVTEIQVLSGKDGSLIWSKDVNISDVGWSRDLNGDGRIDILLINSTKTTETEYLYNVVAISGRDGGKIWKSSFSHEICAEISEGKRYADAYAEAYGCYDVNGDGIVDPYLLIRVSYWDEDSTTWSAIKLILINGEDGSEIWEVECTVDEWLWPCFGTCWDFNNDGIKDVLFGTEKGVYLLTISEATATPEITGCTVISSPGYYYLANDIINSNADVCIRITSSDVILDGRGHVIDGIEVIDGMGSSTAILVSNFANTYDYEILTNVTIKNITITEWYWGVVFDNVKDSRIENCSFSGNEETIRLSPQSINNLIANNTFTNTREGVWVSSINNVIKFNTFSDCMWYGLWVAHRGNIIYLNNFINNNEHILNSGTNRFVSPEPITYTYNGKTFTNYLGNYYDDYSGSDANGDGIGDTPYVIDSNNQDNYPLIEPFENYFAGEKTLSLTVYVYDVDGQIPSQTEGTSIVELIKGTLKIDEKTIDEEGKAVFTVEPGTYILSIKYRDADTGLIEHWGEKTVDVTSGDVTVEFYRYMPYIESVTVEPYENGKYKINVNVKLPSNYPSSGAHVETELKIKNESSMVFHDITSDVWVPKDATQTFVFYFTPQKYGSYHLMAEAYLVGGGELRTDVYGWEKIEIGFKCITINGIGPDIERAPLSFIDVDLVRNGEIVETGTTNLTGVVCFSEVRPGDKLKIRGETYEIKNEINTNIEAHKLQILNIIDVPTFSVSITRLDDHLTFSRYQENYDAAIYFAENDEEEYLVIINPESPHINFGFKIIPKFMKFYDITGCNCYIGPTGEWDETLSWNNPYNYLPTDKIDSFMISNFEPFLDIPPFSNFAMAIKGKVSQGVCAGMVSTSLLSYGYRSIYSHDGKEYKLPIDGYLVEHKPDEFICCNCTKVGWFECEEYCCNKVWTEYGELTPIDSIHLPIIIHQKYQNKAEEYIGKDPERAVEELKKGNPVGVALRYKGGYHAVLAYGYLKNNSYPSYYFQIYDPNEPDEVRWLYYNGKTNEWKYPYDSDFDTVDSFYKIRTLTIEDLKDWKGRPYRKFTRELLDDYELIASNYSFTIHARDESGFEYIMYFKEGKFFTGDPICTDISCSGGYVEYSKSDGNIEALYVVAIPASISFTLSDFKKPNPSQLDPIILLSFSDEEVRGFNVKSSEIISITLNDNESTIEGNDWIKLEKFISKDNVSINETIIVNGSHIILQIKNDNYIVDSNGDGNIDLSLMPPISNFEYDILGLVVNLDASSSYDPDGQIVKYEWDFGDGTSTTTSSPIVQHTYTQSGNYTVTLTVTDNDGLTASISKQVTVSLSLEESNPDNVDDSLEQIVSKYNPTFDWTTSTPTRQDVLQAVINAIDSYFATSDAAEKQQILNDIIQLIDLYFNI